MFPQRHPVAAENELGRALAVRVFFFFQRELLILEENGSPATAKLQGALSNGGMRATPPVGPHHRLG